MIIVILIGCSTTNMYARYVCVLQGCIDRVQNFVVGNLVILGSVGVVLILIQVFVIMFTCCLARSIRKEYEVV